MNEVGREEGVARATLVAVLVGLKEGYRYGSDGDGGLQLRKPGDNSSLHSSTPAAKLAHLSTDRVLMMLWRLWSRTN